MPSQQHKSRQFFDLTKLLFTVVIGFALFFYQVEDIKNPVPMQDPDQTYHHSGVEPAQIPTSSFSLSELLAGFQSQHATRYYDDYTALCQYYTSLCSGIHIQFEDKQGKDYYFALLTLLTLQSMNSRMHGQHRLLTHVLLKVIPNNKRGYATKNSIVMNIETKDSEEFYEVLVHELGHILDLGTLVGKATQLSPLYTEFNDPAFAIDDPSLTYYQLSRASETRKHSESSTADFCTSYGAKNPFEDFAECYNLYVNHYSYFQKISTESSVLNQKFQFIANYVQLKPSPKRKLHEYTNEAYHRFWDSTRLP